VADYKQRWFICPQTVTHPGINRARRRVTSFIETNSLPLRQAADQYRLFQTCSKRMGLY